MTEDLKPCPFCGYEEPYVAVDKDRYIVCPNCLCRMHNDVCVTESDIIKLWNNSAVKCESEVLAIVNGWLDGERFACDLTKEE